MTIAANSSVTRLITATENQATAPALPGSLPTERTNKLDHKIVRICLLLIVVLLDITCVAWVFPIADQLAEWAGVSLLNAIYVGIAVTLASIPLVAVASICAWKFYGRR